jgi:hypothetical protein
MATPTPIAIYGRDAKIAEAVREKLLPDIDGEPPQLINIPSQTNLEQVVHTCLTLSQAESELPLLCAGSLSTTPASGLGSNASLPESSRRVPKAVFFGGFIPEEEVERVQQLVRDKGGAAQTIKFFRITRDEALAAGATGPDPDVIAKIYRVKVAGL